MRTLRSISVALALVLALGASATSQGSSDGDPAEPLVWTRLGRPFGGGTVNEIVALPDGAMLAVGTVGTARVWHSTDGVSWVEVPMPGRDEAWVKDAAVADGGIVAVGTRPGSGEQAPEAVVWSSEDGLE